MLRSALLSTFIAASLLVTAQKSNQQDIKAISKVMQDQQDAWNRADLADFMRGYWNSDSLQFIGRNGVTYGWKTTLENYRKGYPTPEAMGKLTFTVINLKLLSKDHAFMTGRYHLKRTADEPSGYFTLLWRKINGRWVIVADHTS